MGLAGFNNFFKLTIDSTKVDEDLIDFPVNITLSSGTGQTGVDATDVFDELVTISGNKNIAITDSDYNRLYVEIERWDWDNKEANLWVKVPTIASGTDTELYFYYDVTASGQDVRTPAEASDDFTGANGDTPNTDLWFITTNSVAGTAQIYNNKVRAVIPSTVNDEQITINSLFNISGDFDIQIDYTEVSYDPPSSSVSYPASLSITGNSLSSYIGVSVAPSNILKMTTWGSISVWTAIDPHYVSGKLRITRAGSVIKGYYWTGSQWEWDGNTAGFTFTETQTSDISLKFRTIADFDAGTTTDYDNFTINSADGITGWVGDTGEIPAQQVWDSNFVGVWHMSQDPSGGVDAIKDSTSNVNHGTSAGTMLTEDLVDGKIGNALDFDGDNDNIDLGTGYNVTSFTIEAVISNYAVPTAATNILSNYYGASDFQHYGLRKTSSETISFFYDDGTAWDATTGSMDVGSGWFHVVGVLSAGISAHIYINGDSDGTDTSSIPTAITPTDKLYIASGGEEDTYDKWEGIIDEVRISKIDRSVAWIKATYYSNWNDLVTFTPSWVITFIFSSPVPIPYSTVYGIAHQLQLTTTLTGLDSSYIYDASFYDAYDDSQIGSTISGTQSGQYVSTTMTTVSAGDYSWYVTATSSEQLDTSSTYSFSNRFMCSGHTQVADIGASGIPVRLYRRSTGAYIGGAISSGVSGTFDIITDYNEYHYAVALYPTSDTNALIADFLIPSN